MAAADFSLRDTPSPFQALGEISPGKTPRLSLHERRIYGPSPWSRELRGRLPARPEAARLTSGFCTSPRRSRYTAAFSDALTVVTLRFTRVVATNSPEDFHLLADSHAGHTNQRGASSWLPVVVSDSVICIRSSAIVCFHGFTPRPSRYTLALLVIEPIRCLDQERVIGVQRE